MSDPLLDTHYAFALSRLGDAASSATEASSVEEAFIAITQGAIQTLGRRPMPTLEHALRPGERQFFVCGVFLVLPDDAGHVLVAEQGFPPEQRRLRIEADIGHPGWVYRNQRALLLANTDEHADFKQILKTSRMGSAMYVPLFWNGEMFGQLILAAQARGTFGPADLQTLEAFAGIATMARAALGPMPLDDA